MNKKRCIALVLGATMITSSIAGITTSVSAAEHNIYSSGVRISDDFPNKKITWTIDDSNNTLTIEGKGNLPNYPSGDNTPWLDYLDKFKITKIELGKDIKNIGSYIFSSLTDLEEINAPGVTSIGSNAFNGCKALTKIDAPNLGSIGGYAFSGCKSLENFSIGSKLHYIGSYAFEDCTMLRSVTGTGKAGRGNNKFRIGGYAFSSCDSLSTFNVKNVQELGSYCFNKSLLLKKVVAPRATIKGYCFGKGEQSIHTAEVGSLDNSALKDNTVIKNLTLSNATFIGNNALEGATKITTLTAPKVTKVGNYAFKDTNISTVNLKNVKSIGSYAFANCSKLVNANLGTNISSVGSGAFLNCQKLKSFINLKNVKTISTNAFANCKGIKCNSLGNKLTKVGSNAFSGCNSIKNLYVPSSCKTIGSNLSSKIRSVNSNSVSVENNTERIKIITPKNSPIYKKYEKNKHNKKYLVNAVNKITLNKKIVSLKKGKKFVIKATVNSDAKYKAIKIETTNTKVATLGKNGSITAKGKGSCYIVVTAKDGSYKTAKCKVVVK